MKVFAVNGSPKMDKGNTSLILNPFLEGMREGGAEISLFYTSKLKIKPCIGDFVCWEKKPGQCFIQDDMQMLYPELRRADILVLATPVYIPLPGDIENFLNRIVPIMEPALKTKAGRTRARLRRDVKISKMVLVSTCGWWEKGNFGTALRIAKELAEDINIEFAGALLRPHSDFIREDNEKTRKVLKAAKKAGYQLVKEGKIDPEILKEISRPLISRKKYIDEGMYEMQGTFGNSYENLKPHA
jgi:multimeric flavodoxin WrbA